ncbi:MAG: ThuA domain-containing protein [Kiritimatiellae bacterium]|nr:ThuA domain-containing protein [Kiritimatiellia bacterium]
MMKFCTGIIVIMFSLSAMGAVQEPEPRHCKEVQAVLDKVPKPVAEELKELTIVLIADKKDHGPNEHDYPLWQKRWGLLLGGKQGSDSETQVNLYGPSPTAVDNENCSGASKVKVVTAWQWPTEGQWKSADLVVAFCYVGWNDQKFKDLETFLARGGGFVMIHSATWTKPSPSSKLATLAGVGGFTRWRHGLVDLKVTANHPICLGMPEHILFTDEPYWPPSPAMNPDQIQVLAVSDEKLQKDSDVTEPQPMFWTHQHGKGRVFGCVLGHYTFTFDDPYFRLLLLRGMAWSTGESPYRFDSLVLRGARLVP